MIAPFATQEPSPNHGGELNAPPLGVVEHVTAGEADPGGWFANPLSQVSAHFGIGNGQGGMADGEIAQYVDTSLQSWAQMAGNAGYISVETEGEPTDPLTNNQVLAFARIMVWLVQTGTGIPLAIIDTPGQRGLITHGDGGAAWGNHEGCPGVLRASQRGAIIYIAGLVLDPPPKEAAVSVSQTVSINPGQLDVFHIRTTGDLVHNYHTGAGWYPEVIAGPESGSKTGEIATFPAQPLNPVMLDGQCMITVEDNTGAAWYFAQSIGGTTWGANKLPG